MMLDCYSFDHYREPMDNCLPTSNTYTYIPKKKPCFEIRMFALMSPLFLFLTYPYIPGKNQINNNQASYSVSTRITLYSASIISNSRLHNRQSATPLYDFLKILIRFYVISFYITKI